MEAPLATFTSKVKKEFKGNCKNKKIHKVVSTSMSIKIISQCPLIYPLVLIVPGEGLPKKA